MKRKTIGIDPKLPITAIVAVIVYILAKFGISTRPSLQPSPPSSASSVAQPGPRRRSATSRRRDQHRRVLRGKLAPKCARFYSQRQHVRPLCSERCCMSFKAPGSALV
jgi:hypothetical protein